MLGRVQELGLKVAFTDVNAVAQPAEPKPSYFAVRDALVAGRLSFLRTLSVARCEPR